MEIKELASKYSDYVISMRREFHQIPEASLEEHITSRRILKELEDIGISAQIIADTGVLVTIKGQRTGKTVALRADIDGLAVEEKLTVPYASKHPGLMHACGHDGHIAVMLGAARILHDIQGELNGTVKILFEPGEECAKGAKKMIAAGALDGVDSIFGLHVWSDLAAGKVSIEPGARMASADFFFVDIKGKSCHGGMPQQGVDAIVVGTAIVQNLQSLVSREVNPLEPVVLSVCEFNAGSRYNVIAGDARLTGTVRTFNNDLRNQMPQMMERMMTKTAQAYRATMEFTYDMGSSVVINEPVCTAIAQKSATKIMGEDALGKLEKTPGGENFSEYQMLVPGVFAFLGVRNEKIGADFPHHSAYFSMDESVLIHGSAIAAQYAVDFLNGE